MYGGTSVKIFFSFDPDNMTSEAFIPHNALPVCSPDGKYAPHNRSFPEREHHDNDITEG
jgi:hypothetical protein